VSTAIDGRAKDLVIEGKDNETEKESAP